MQLTTLVGRWSKSTTILIAGGLLALVLAVTIGPYLWFGSSSFIRIHDYLDSRFVWAKLLFEEGYLFAHPMTIVDPIMGGHQRWMLGKPFDVHYLSFAAFPPFTAIVFNEAIQRAVAFVGMFFLARRHLLSESDAAATIAVFVAAGYAAMPFWPGGGIDVAATPLIISAFLDARTRSHLVVAFGVALVFGIFVSFWFVGLFVLFALGLVWLWDAYWAPRKAFGPALWFLLLFAALQAAGEYQLILAMASGEAEPVQRLEFKLETLSFAGAIQATIQNFLTGQNHARPAQELVILPLAFIALTLVFVFRRRVEGTRLRQSLVFWLSAALVTAFVYGFWMYEPIQAGWQALRLPYLNLARFHWLQPVIWFSVFAISLDCIARIGAGRRYRVVLIVAVLGLIQLGYSVSVADQMREARTNGIDFSAFFSERLFGDIRAEIGGDIHDYRVASVGLEPSIALFNGFRTVDGYLNMYSLRYKHQFREIIAGELAKDEKIRRYFDNWGSRAYIFAADLKSCGRLCIAKRAPPKITLSFDGEAFKALGGRYLLAVSEIANSDELGLVSRGVFERVGSPWRIHLYEAR